MCGFTPSENRKPPLPPNFAPNTDRNWQITTDNNIYIIKTQLLCVCVCVCPDCIKEMEE